MKPNKAALHNLKQKQQKQHFEKDMTQRTLRVALVMKPDGDWVAVGGNNPESERMAKAVWGTPDGSISLWADVIVTLPGKFAEPKEAVKNNPSPAQTEATESSTEERQETKKASNPFGEAASAAPQGAFIGPGDTLPIIDVVPME